MSFYTPHSEFGLGIIPRNLAACVGAVRVTSREVSIAWIRQLPVQMMLAVAAYRALALRLLLSNAWQRHQCVFIYSC